MNGSEERDDSHEAACFVRPWLQAYIRQLESNPLRTKMLTAGSLAGTQELLASWLAKDHNKHGHYFTSRVPKMAAYGALVSAPLGHVLIWILQKIFKGRTSLRAKILQIIVSNLIVRPPSPLPPGHGLIGLRRLRLSKTPSIWLPWPSSLVRAPLFRSAPPSMLAFGGL